MWQYHRHPRHHHPILSMNGMYVCLYCLLYWWRRQSVVECRVSLMPVLLLFQDVGSFCCCLLLFVLERFVLSFWWMFVDIHARCMYVCMYVRPRSLDPRRSIDDILKLILFDLLSLSRFVLYISRFAIGPPPPKNLSFSCLLLVGGGRDTLESPRSVLLYVVVVPKK